MRFLSIGAMQTPLYSYPAHAHPYWEIIIYTHGDGLAIIGDERVQFRPGTIICMPPHIKHKESARNGFRNLFIHVDGFRPRTTGAPVFADTSERLCLALGSQILNEFHLKTPGWQALCHDLFTVLMRYIELSAARGSRLPADDLKFLIVSNIQNAGFKVSSAAQSLTATPDYLRKLFTRQMGKSPHQYLNEMRAETAKGLLRVEGYSIKEVAERSGFSDPCYFSRFFHKMCGVSPLKFRKRDKATQQ